MQAKLSQLARLSWRYSVTPIGRGGKVRADREYTELETALARADPIVRIRSAARKCPESVPGGDDYAGADCPLRTGR
jgi:hypothetical protein